MPSFPPAKSIGVIALAVGTPITLAGCGQTPPDLFQVERSGNHPGANLTFVVSDAGMISCNGAKQMRLTDPRTLAARDIARDLKQPASLGLKLPPTRPPVLSYKVRVESGTIEFADTARSIPKEFQRLAAFTKDVAENVCSKPEK